MPILSVVIPTHKRPQFLSRAINSALQAAPDGDVEVIVVPNGSDTEWRTIAEKYIHEPRVLWQPITTAHANAARNHGMKFATGEYIRFLDDDDFFYPEAATQQLVELIHRDFDISFGQILITDVDGNPTRLAKQLDTEDFTEAVLSPALSAVPCALVFRKALTEGISWDPSVPKLQDLYWAWSLCEKQELSSFRFRQAVGAWVQHSIGSRVSKGHHPKQVARHSATRIMTLVEVLRDRDKLTKPRADAAAEYLWRCLHQGIMYQPFFWMGISKEINLISSKCRPQYDLHKWPIIKKINPLVVELAIIPYRWIKILFGHRYTV